MHPVPHRQYGPRHHAQHENPGQRGGQKAAPRLLPIGKPAVRAYSLIWIHIPSVPRPSESAWTVLSKIRGDAFVFPIAIAGRLRPLWALELLRRRLSVGVSSLATRFGLGERPPGRRRKRFAFLGRCGRRRP